MKRSAPRAGYTIVEVMIFLAVSGALAISAMILVGGRQAKEQFNQGVRDFDSKTQDIINNVSTGYYTRLNNKYTCLGNPTRLSIGVATDVGQGKNTDCIYIGQIIQFAPNGTGAHTLNLYSAAGSRLKTVSPPQEATDIRSSVPLIIAPGNTNDVSGPDSTEVYNLLGNVTIQNVTYNNGAGWTTAGAIGFFTTFGQYAGNKLVSGSAHTDTIVMPVVTLGQDTKTAIDNMDTALNSGSFISNPASGIKICLASGNSSDQVAILTILGGSNTTTNVDLFNNFAQANAANPSAGVNVC